MTRINAAKKDELMKEICQRFNLPKQERNWTKKALTNALNSIRENLQSLQSSRVEGGTWEDFQNREEAIREECQLSEILKGVIEKKFPEK